MRHNIVFQGVMIFGFLIGSAVGKCIHFNGTTWTTINSDPCPSTRHHQYIGGHGQETVERHFPSRKSWWTKRLTNYGQYASRVYFGGQPSIRDLKFLYEQGFTAVYSLWPFRWPGRGTEIDSVTQMPTGAKAAAAAAEVGLLYRIIPQAPRGHNQANFWHSAGGINDITQFMDFALAETQGAVFFHCYNGATSSAALQMWRARKGYISTQANKTMTQQAIIEAAYHGYDISMWKASIAREAGETLEPTAAMPIVDQATKLEDGARFGLAKYHWFKYMDRWHNTRMFNAGQFRKEHIQVIKDAGIKVVVNFRNTSESVNLLNVRSSLAQSTGFRSNATYLADPLNAQYLVSPNRPVNWTSTPWNFEVVAFDEFSDNQSYNETLEREAIFAAGLNYVNLPIGKDGPYTAEGLVQYSQEMIKAINNATANGGHVLFHCRTGYRSGSYSMALLAAILDKNSTEVQNKMARLGYDNSKSFGAMLAKVKDVLWIGTEDENHLISGRLSVKGGVPVTTNS